MANIAGKLGWKVVTLVFAVPISMVVRKLIEKAWVKARPNDPPRDPASPGTTWLDALAWAAVSGIGVAAGRVLASRGAATAWRGLTGTEPPGSETQAEAAAAARS
ncbi:MAG: hypothetical protein JWN61_2905 [Pseudonocardiales bacterium]|nr:hypothetical protein [Jatrophihabitantaceae bacterium]MCW2604770.1 hypothetical protein [Pseudonocardiales bacterium]